MGEWLQYDRQALAGGELWRVLTCHLVHFGAEHLVWDLAAFVVLAALCWRLAPARCLAGLAAAALAIPAVLWVARPDLQTYRGLSGLDSALFVTAALGLGRRLWDEGRRLGACCALSCLAALAAKVAYETATGQTLFVGEAAAFVPVPLAHAVGGAAGALAALPWRAAGPPGGAYRRARPA